MRDGEEGPIARGPAPRKAPRKNLGSEGDLGTVMQFGISIILFTLIGSWLDRKFGTSPVLLLAGMGIGAGAGFYSMYTKLTANERKKSQDRMGANAGNGNAVADNDKKRGKD